jgi:hypothetical protein
VGCLLAQRAEGAGFACWRVTFTAHPGVQIRYANLSLTKVTQRKCIPDSAGHRALRDDFPTSGKISGVGLRAPARRTSCRGVPKPAIHGRFTPKIFPPIGCYDGEQRAAVAALTAQQIQKRKPENRTRMVNQFGSAF